MMEIKAGVMLNICLIFQQKSSSVCSMLIKKKNM